eukprot:CAMPEP_0177756434 /NCGR_PEP_ID=MMETSP0491_2-20121128/3103_1 /TAXON_ID=63592 /ORGANISM="Tetraselmis chuii, Strain PLY429" /LENGTH=256 /DNA_ID=CAMNT_0019272009 /DNA_START=456 /DNA_END=1226 /DNA_ORIENTATION=+
MPLSGHVFGKNKSTVDCCSAHGGGCSRSSVCLASDVAWLDIFTAQSTSFFNPCPNCVGTGREVTTNFFCVDCCDPIGFCSTCAADHAGHRFLQIRRSSYHDVVKVQDLQAVADIAGIQTYMINSSRVIFVKQRPQPRPSNALTTCELCSRQVQDNNKYCSLRCKLECAGVVEPDTPPPARATKKSGLAPTVNGAAPAAGAVQQPGTPSNSEGALADSSLSDRSDVTSNRKRRASEARSSRNRNTRRKSRPLRSPLQ